MLSLLLTALWACRPTPAPTEPTAEPTPEAPEAPRPNGILAEGTRPDRPLRDADDLVGEPAFVLLVILDTVRADRTSLCGHTSPTTPTLRQLVAQGARHTCRAYSPAPWTLPSHASYFTGLSPEQHGVHHPGSTLDDDVTTLAERFADRGYQTLLISANPTLGSRDTGLWQGFDRVVVARGLVGPLRTATRNVLRKELVRIDRSAPLFLVVNLFDAHDPYPEVPDGLPWVSPQPTLWLGAERDDLVTPYRRFVTGQMPEDEAATFLGTVRTGYDHGVHVADRHLGVLLRGLGKLGWLRRPHRLVVTSDHGEHLGEHGLLRHGSRTSEAVTRVPLVFRDTTVDETPPLPEPLSATAVFSLLTEGRVESTGPVQSGSVANPDDVKPSFTTVSLWATDDKVTRREDGARVVDLVADPSGTTERPLPADHPLSKPLSAAWERHVESVQTARTA